MDYQKRLTDLMNERNNIMAQIAQPLARVNQIDGQISVLLEFKTEDEAAKKSAVDTARLDGKTEPVDVAA